MNFNPNLININLGSDFTINPQYKVSLSPRVRSLPEDHTPIYGIPSPLNFLSIEMQSNLNHHQNTASQAAFTLSPIMLPSNSYSLNSPLYALPSETQALDNCLQPIEQKFPFLDYLSKTDSKLRALNSEEMEKVNKIRFSASKRAAFKSIGADLITLNNFLDRLSLDQSKITINFKTLKDLTQKQILELKINKKNSYKCFQALKISAIHKIIMESTSIHKACNAFNCKIKNLEKFLEKFITSEGILLDYKTFKKMSEEEVKNTAWGKDYDNGYMIPTPPSEKGLRKISEKEIVFLIYVKECSLKGDLLKNLKKITNNRLNITQDGIKRILKNLFLKYKKLDFDFLKKIEITSFKNILVEKEINDFFAAVIKVFPGENFEPIASTQSYLTADMPNIKEEFESKSPSSPLNRNYSFFNSPHRLVNQATNATNLVAPKIEDTNLVAPKIEEM